MTLKKLEFYIILGLSTMAKDKVLIVGPTLATLRNLKRGKVKETLLLIKIKPKGKTQEIKGRCRRTPQGKYINDVYNFRRSWGI